MIRVDATQGSFLVRLKRGDGHRVVPATFGATENCEIFENIHFAQRQRCRMGFKAAGETGLSVWRWSGIRRCLRFFRGGRAKPDTTYGDIMSKPARRAGQSKLIVVRDPPHGNAEWMHGPTLLEERPASKHLPHHIRVSRART